MLEYIYKYPYIYGELVMQGKTKKECAKILNITVKELERKQRLDTDDDFSGEEMKAIALYLKRPLEYLFYTEI
jgi:hypothetical protein